MTAQAQAKRVTHKTAQKKSLFGSNAHSQSSEQGQRVLISPPML